MTTLEKLLRDAQQLLGKMKQNDTVAENITEQFQQLNSKIEASKKVSWVVDLIRIVCFIIILKTNRRQMPFTRSPSKLKHNEQMSSILQRALDRAKWWMLLLIIQLKLNMRYI